MCRSTQKFHGALEQFALSQARRDAIPRPVYMSRIGLSPFFFAAVWLSEALSDGARKQSTGSLGSRARIFRG